MTVQHSPEYWLRRNFREVLGLPEDACDWLIHLWRAIQVFDDMADGDDIDRADLNQAIWSALIGLPSNGFFKANASTLLPLLMVAILKWQASDDVERCNRANATSFVWRAGYYDIVLAAILIVHGAQIATELAPLVMDLYGEKLEDYLEEMSNA